MGLFVAWMHDDCGYSYLGPERYGKLTLHELQILQLGFLIQQEQREDKIDDVNRGHQHSKSRSDTRKLAKERVRGYD